MMRHEGADHGALLAGRQSRSRAVDRFVETVASRETEGFEAPQIGERSARHERQREHAGIGGDYEVVFQATLEAEVRHAEGPVLVVLMRVELVVPPLGDAPGHAATLAVGDLHVDRGNASATDEAVLALPHEERRHEVLEHGPAPREQRPQSIEAAEGAAKMEPVLLGHLALRDGEEAREPGLRGEEVIVVLVRGTRGDVVADVQEVAALVVEPGEVHLEKEFLRLAAERREGVEEALTGCARLREGRGEMRGPGPRVERRDLAVGQCVQHFVDARKARGDPLAGRGQVAERGLRGKGRHEGGPRR